jgi:hypothetical protein
MHAISALAVRLLLIVNCPVAIIIAAVKAFDWRWVDHVANVVVMGALAAAIARFPNDVVLTVICLDSVVRGFRLTDPGVRITTEPKIQLPYVAIVASVPA